jgi:adenine phosphoribosyltransferase
MRTNKATIEDLIKAVRTIPDFPKPGIQFKDITPVLADRHLFVGCIDLIAAKYAPGSVDIIAGIDARGFILAAAVALKLNAGFVPIRKKGKLPYKTIEQSYDLEYGSNTLSIHEDAFPPGSKVLLVDDLLATGGTAGAAISLLQKLQANILEAAFFVELKFLNGRSRIPNLPIRSLAIF